MIPGRQARWWHHLTGEGGSRVPQCLLCPRRCVIPDGASGYCGVRRSVGSSLQTMVYGNLSSAMVDPIEKKPLYHFLPGSSAFSVGTVGCSLDCFFCQNWRLSRGEVEWNEDTPGTSPETLVSIAREERCASLAFTYNEPTILAEYVVDAARCARREGLRTVLVTNGYVAEEVVDELYEHVDGANVDLKGLDPDFYRAHTGASLKAVLAAIKRIHQLGTVWLELTNLLIPGLNDHPAAVDALCNWVLDNLGPEVPIHFSAFHPAYRAMEHRRTPVETIYRARNQALEKGVLFSYAGNVNLPEGADTYCQSCGKTLIHRQAREGGVGWTASSSGPGRCDCGYGVPGVFGAAQGQ